MTIRAYIRHSMASPSANVQPSQQGVITKYLESEGKLLAAGAEVVFYVDENTPRIAPLSDRSIASQLLVDLKPGDAVVTASLDRLFVSPADALEQGSEWKERGIDFHIADMGRSFNNDALTPMFFAVAAGASELEEALEDAEEGITNGS